MSLTKVKGKVLPLQKQVTTITPEQFGAKGNGIVDDTNSWKALWTYVQANASKTNPIDIVANNYYLLTDSLILPSYYNLYGTGTLYYNGPNLEATFILNIANQQYFTIRGISITRNWSDPSLLWSKSGQGLNINVANDFILENLDIYMHTDAVSITQASNFSVLGCKTHELGEEGIAIRKSNTFLVSNNRVYHHHGDGILFKTGNVECYDGTISNNFIFDGYKSPNAAVGQRGGGITLNDENLADGGSSYTFKGLTVSDNTMRNLSYGIAFTNVENLIISNNKVKDVERFGIVIDTTPFNNPQLNPVKRLVVTGNLLQNVGQVGIGFQGANGIAVDMCTISSNVIENAGTNTSAEYAAIVSNIGTIIGNSVYNCRIALQATGTAVVSGNHFENSTATVANANSNWIKTGESCTFTGNTFIDTNLGHIRIGNASGFVFTGNSVKLASTFAGLYFITGVTSPCKFSGNYYNCAYASVSNFNIGSDPIRQLRLGVEEFGRVYGVYDGNPPNLEHKVGDMYEVNTASSGNPRKFICVAAGTPGTFVAFETVPLTISCDAQDVTVAANSTNFITVSTASGVGSNWLATGVSSNKDKSTLFITAAVTGPQTVKFKLENTSASPVTITGLILTTKCYSS